MQSMIRKALMFSMLFMSIEGAADIVSDGHPHGDDPTHAVDVKPSSEHDPAAAVDLNTGHSEDCCHGHLASIMVAPPSSTAYVHRADLQSGDAPFVPNYAQAPPNPPPNA